MHVYVTTREEYEVAIKSIKLGVALYPVIQVDTETTGLDPHSDRLLLLQFGGLNAQFVFNFTLLNIEGVDWTPIKDFLENDSITKILHNAKFDYKVLLSALNVRMRNMRDTMIAVHLLRAGFTKMGASLENLLEEYNIGEKKSEIRKDFVGHSGKKFTDQQINYAADDVKYLEKLHTRLMRDIEELNLVNVYNIECSAIAGTAEMEYNGIYLDYGHWSALEAKAKKERVEKQKILDNLMIPFVGANLLGEANINYGSPVQLKPVLERVLKVNLDDTRDETLEQYIGNEIIDALRALRKAEKKITTYGSKFYQENVNSVTKRVHCNFAQTGRTDSGRYASSNPNMQNIPRLTEYRAAFRAQSPEWKIIGADYSGMELRLLAEFSQDAAFMDMFLKDLDAHCHVASMIFRKPIRKEGKKYIDNNGEVQIAKEDIDVHLRPVGKNINFGVAYGQGPSRLAKKLTAEGVPTTLQEAKDILNKFWTAFPEVKSFLEGRVAQALRDGYVESHMDGRRRWLNNLNLRVAKHAAHAKNIAKNMSLQSGNATITKKAIALLIDEIRERGWFDICKLILTVHDELIIECKSEIAEDAHDLLKTCMLNASRAYIHTIPIKVDSYIADCWQK